MFKLVICFHFFIHVFTVDRLYTVHSCLCLHLLFVFTGRRYSCLRQLFTQLFVLRLVPFVQPCPFVFRQAVQGLLMHLVVTPVHVSTSSLCLHQLFTFSVVDSCSSCSCLPEVIYAYASSSCLCLNQFSTFPLVEFTLLTYCTTEKNNAKMCLKKNVRVVLSVVQQST